MGHHRHGGRIAIHPLVNISRQHTKHGRPPDRVAFARVAQATPRFVEEHDAETAHDNVKWLIEGGGLGIALDEGDVNPLFLGLPLAQPQQWRREVEAGHPHAGPYRVDCLHAYGAVVASDVEDQSPD